MARRLKWFFIFCFGCALIGLTAIVVISWNLPSVSSLKNFHPKVVSEVFSNEYVKIGEFYQERRILVPLSQLPPLLVKAFISAEDAAFFEHRGISPTGILRAFIKNMLAGEVKQGGSTITQQVAKALLLTPERSLIRKIREAILAFKMEGFLTKEEILEIYLNQIYLGHSAYGVQAAAQVYLNKDVADLSLGEIAMLAGLTSAPSRDNPHVSLKRAREQQSYVLHRMLDEKYITKKELKAALEENISPEKNANLNLRYAPYFVEHVRRYVTEKYGDQLVLTGGLQIFTTLNTSAALSAQKALRKGIEELDRHQGYRGPLKNVNEVEWPATIQKLSTALGDKPLEPDQKYKALVTKVDDKKGLVFVSLGTQSGVIPIKEMEWARKPDPEKLWSNHLIKKPSEALKPGDVIRIQKAETQNKKYKDIPSGTIVLSLAQEPIAQGALVALDPLTGAIHAMVGGYDFSKSEFNRAVQARRQPGSAFKPIIYVTALDKGYTPASLILDAPIVYDDPSTEFRWKPKNFGGKFHGETIFRDCLIKSINIPSIKIIQDIGIDSVLQKAENLGISSPLSRDYSLALGSSGITPLELVSAYAVFAAGGKKFDTPIFIKKIINRDGKILEQNLAEDPGIDLLSQAEKVTQQLNLKKTHTHAMEVGKDVNAELPEGYVLSPQTAYIMTHLLKQVIRSGTGRRAAAVNRPAAGKTGTTNDNLDAWFIGYTPNLVAGVWVGFDEMKTLGVREEGGRAASPIWLKFMQETLKDTPEKDFQIPEGLVFAQIDTKTGKLATERTQKAIFEVFREGTEPKETSEEAQSRKSPQQFFLQD